MPKVEQRLATLFDRPERFSVMESPFATLYMVVDRTAPINRTPWLVDRAVTLLFDGSWHRVTADNHMVELPDKEVALVRAALMRTIRTDKFIVVRYGSGRRTIIMNQAVDCGWCRRLEANLSRLSTELDATVYFIPGAVDARNPQAVALAMSIYCAKDRTQAWHDWMLRQIAPSSSACSAYSYALHTAVSDSLFGGRGTPVALLDDGRMISPAASSDDVLKAVFGSGLHRTNRSVALPQ